jgi:hypothetical protein
MAKSFICGCKRYASFSDVAQLGEGNSRRMAHIF